VWVGSACASGQMSVSVSKFACECSHAHARVCHFTWKIILCRAAISPAGEVSETDFDDAVGSLESDSAEHVSFGRLVWMLDVRSGCKHWKRQSPGTHALTHIHTYTHTRTTCART